MNVVRSKPIQLKPSWGQVALLSALGPILLAGAAFWLGVQIRDSEQARRSVQASYAYRDEIKDLFSLLKDAETGQRGYVITGDRSFLTPFEGASADLDAHMARLERLAPKRARDKADFLRLKSLIRDKFSEMLAVIGCATGLDCRSPRRGSDRVKASGRWTRYAPPSAGCSSAAMRASRRSSAIRTCATPIIRE